eukprot:TRINITY_DN6046_c0_g1_i1.p2 TRINITY_DN6046_c0_g1~~TRINITY_DN6046_c0_g1_i1.p2  ORF type:complete len:193 (-),score=49.88 TRINITY_DN6046_c0_g1_i1:42-620(-)
MVMLGLALGLMTGTYLQSNFFGKMEFGLYNHYTEQVEFSAKYLRKSPIWLYMAPSHWALTTRLFLGFGMLNLVFFILLQILMLITTFIFGLSILQGPIQLVDRICSKFAFPSFPPISNKPPSPSPVAKTTQPTTTMPSEIPDAKTEKKKRVKRNLPADPLTWSRFLTAAVVALVVTHFVPASFKVAENVLLR